MLKAFVVLALFFTCELYSVAAATEQALVVGSVRDFNGRPIAGASVSATDARGIFAGEDRTDVRGTFALHLVRAASNIEVRCGHCRTERVTATAGANVAIVVMRYAALESNVPDANDLAALPYGRIADAAALVPFVLAASGGGAISDRGLGGGRGLVVDDGAALADLATGSSALIDFSDRSAKHIVVTRSNEAFQYGPDAAAGVFALDTLDDAPSASLDVGATPALALAPVFDTVHPAFGLSNDGGALSRRSDLDFVTPFVGGALRAGFTSGSERVDTSALAFARDLESARLAYATASPRYRTFVDFSASRVVVAETGSPRADYASAYSGAGLRIEHPGVVTVAAGIRATLQTATYDRYTPLPSALDGRATSVTTYVAVHGGDERTGFDAGVSSAGVTTQATFANVPTRATQWALLPSFGARSSISSGLYARAGLSGSLRLSTLLESESRPTITPLRPQRSTLIDSALGFDAGGRLKVEAIAYRELTEGGSERRLDGVGASVAWQISPFISLRAWSLQIDPPSAVTQPSATPSSTSRQVVWATFDHRNVLRLDAIAHRDVAGDRRAAVALDGDVLLPLVSHVSIDVTTSRRDGIRKYSVGLRAR